MDKPISELYAPIRVELTKKCDRQQQGGHLLTMNFFRGDKALGNKLQLISPQLKFTNGIKTWPKDNGAVDYSMMASLHLVRDEDVSKSDHPDAALMQQGQDAYATLIQDIERQVREQIFAIVSEDPSCEIAKALGCSKKQAIAMNAIEFAFKSLIKPGKEVEEKGITYPDFMACKVPVFENDQTRAPEIKKHLFWTRAKNGKDFKPYNPVDESGQPIPINVANIERIIPKHSLGAISHTISGAWIIAGKISMRNALQQIEVNPASSTPQTCHFGHVDETDHDPILIEKEEPEAKRAPIPPSDDHGDVDSSFDN